MKIPKGDLIIVGVILVIGVFGILFTMDREEIPLDSKNEVAIEVDGEVINTYPLVNNAETFTVESDRGYNVVQIANDRVRINEADCPDQICVHFGWVQRAGQAIVCLPHRLVVRVVEEEEDEFSLDGVTF